MQIETAWRPAKEQRPGALNKNQFRVLDIPDNPDAEPPCRNTKSALIVFGRGAGSTVSDAADPATRTFEARYVLTGVDAAAPLGSTVTVEIPTSASIAGLQVPVTSLTDRGRGPGVWVLNSATSTVAFRPVHIQQLGDEEATLSEGVRPGEQIVTLGAHLLTDGEKVRTPDERAAIQ